MTELPTSVPRRKGTPRDGTTGHVTGRRVLAIGLDGFEISYAERLMSAGAMPVLAALRDRSARVLLDHGPARRTGLAWEHFWSGLSPEVTHRSSVIEFDPQSYTVWQGGARFEPFFASLDVKAVVFDPPYADLRLAHNVEGVVAWGAHDPGVERTGANPEALLGELRSRVGPYPADECHYAIPWASPDATRAMAQGLVAGLSARSEATRWLLADRIDDWDLAIVVAAEPHSAAEGLWHGVDESHPLHEHPSARPAADGLADVYRATDRFVGDLVDATGASTVVVFSLGGMGTNGSDVASMGLLPELLFRWSLGERLLEIPPEWSSEPYQVPLLSGGEDSRWQRAWYPRVRQAKLGDRARALVRRFPSPVLGSLRRIHSAFWPLRRPTGYSSLDWQPVSWYRPWWPQMRAFALPSFSPGRIRVNLCGRERHGLVVVSDYQRVCDDLERLIQDCRDPRTGEPIAELIERPSETIDPRALDSSAADLVIVWHGSAVAFEHPEYGLIGPLPYRRTGGHTGPYGFAYFDGPDVEPGDYGIASTFTVAPTLVDLISDRPVDSISDLALQLHSGL